MQTSNVVSHSLICYYRSFTLMNSFISIFLKWLMFSYFLIRSFIMAKRPKKFCRHWVDEFHLRSCMYFTSVKTSNRIANISNNYFSTIGRKTLAKTKYLYKNYTDHLTNKIPNSSFLSHTKEKLNWITHL